MVVGFTCLVQAKMMTRLVVYAYMIKIPIFFLIPIILYSTEKGAATIKQGLFEMRRGELPREVKMSKIAKKRWRS
jgi:hypothetical protein